MSTVPLNVGVEHRFRKDFNDITKVLKNPRLGHAGIYAEFLGREGLPNVCGPIL